MLFGRRPWDEELAIIDRTMKAISTISDPQELVDVYWDGIGELLPIVNYVSLSRRGLEPPFYLITRSSRYTEDLNPWTQRNRFPRLSGGVLGEIVYANKPVIIEDLPDRLMPGDPALFHLEGFQTLVALPQYDGGEGLNVSCSLLPAGAQLDRSLIPLLHWQSGLFGRGTQNLVLRNQLGAALSALDRELQVVGDIQRSLLPQQLPQIPGFDLAAHYLTSSRAGGDYYDFFPLPDGRWGVFIADVSGHGPPATVLMAITHTIAHSQPGSHTPPPALLTYLNDRLTHAYTGAGTFVTAFYAVLDPARRTLTYSSAGHNPPRLLRDGQILSLTDAAALPLGIDGAQRYTEATINLERGDLLLLYTDGITEAMATPVLNRSPELFGQDRLDRLLLDSAPPTAQACIDRVCAAITAFSRSGPPNDDQTLIAMRCI